jgi:YYY domain-containing protein
MNDSVTPSPSQQRSSRKRIADVMRPYLPGLMLLLILVLAASLRLVGLDWDAHSHNHPDERFLTMVESSIHFPDSIAAYFDTNNSTLNPHNMGYGFFVYGTFPIFIVRAVAEWAGKTGYDEVYLVGRAVSVFFDLVTIFVVYLIGKRLYRPRVGLLAAFFTSLSVLLIQHAHFFVVDPVANAFILAGLYFAIRIFDNGEGIDYTLFGILLGLSVASKINAVPLAGMAALAAAARVFTSENDQFLRELKRAAIFLVLAAFLSVLTFRIFQPYAFEGPSFFNVGLNQRWMDNMSEIQGMNRGDTDAPYALQWADRTPIVFSLKNLILWGLGLPLGIMAWAGWALALWEMFHGRWRRHFIAVIWTGAYFLWQSFGFTPAMRYQIPVYPTLTLMAAWGLWRSWEKAHAVRVDRRRLAQILVAGIACLTIVWTIVWALAFTSIYTRPLTRVEASEWIYTHVPAAINVVIDTEDGPLYEPLAVPLNVVLAADKPYETSFKSDHSGLMGGISLASVRELSSENKPILFSVAIAENKPDGVVLGTEQTEAALIPDTPTNIDLRFENPIEVLAGRSYVLTLGYESTGAVELDREISILVDVSGMENHQAIKLPESEYALGSAANPIHQFTSHLDGEIVSLYFPYVFDASSPAGSERNLQIELLRDPVENPLAVATFQGAVAEAETEIEVQFDAAIPVAAGETYYLRFSLLEGTALALRASAIVSETTWDDGLPFRIGGYDIGGRYSSLNQELYWDDAADDDRSGVSDKLERIISTLSQGDYFVITSNRQYGTITRVPIRYPLTIAYYRALLDCAEPAAVLSCGAEAQTGETGDSLGYELVQVFESNPQLGPIEISDQLAEEAFTVYDHPKVLIFRKTEDFTPEAVIDVLEKVDLSQVQHVLPKDVGKTEAPRSLLLSESTWEEQQESGTWSELFDRSSLINRNDVVAVVVWWLAITVIGWIAFPITRMVFGGFKNAGYPISRIVGLLLVAWGSWLLGSLGINVSRMTILVVVAMIAVISMIIVWVDREKFLQFLQDRKREILITEAIVAVFFLFDLFIRLGNPDLWHPAFGGEKPMDFSYLNAVLKSTSFPPYDPWFAGGYINYYYFGFVIVGMPIKLLGILPSIAYNLVIPTLFALLAMAGYCVAYNLVAFTKGRAGNIRLPSARTAGIAAALVLVLLGNLGTADMLYDEFKAIGAAPEPELTGLLGTFQALAGFVRFVGSGFQFQIPLHHWYWNPSRAIMPGPGEVGPITEFPFFTFLYADLHAHMISRPLTILCIAWILSRLLLAARKERGGWLEFSISILFGGILFGALGPTNMADYPVYWTLGAIGAAYAVLLFHRKISLRSIFEALLIALVLIGLAKLLYQPFHASYAQGYNKLEIWRGAKTSFVDYFTVHGLFLFMIASWLIWESIRWMGETPLSALQRLQPYLWFLIGFGGVVFTAVMAVLIGLGYPATWFAIPIITLAGLLLLRRDLAVERRVVLSLIGVAIALTFFVEVVVVSATIDRMNTVFKFYMQVWDMLSVAAGAILAWILVDLPTWRRAWRGVWRVLACVMIVSALLYPLFAAPAKIRDRWVPEAPHLLDGMAFMPYAVRAEMHDTFSLQEDYDAIRWMQDNVEGTPVILEVNAPEYRWGSRFTIYTGLPGVIGWLNHQRQQRVKGPAGAVEERAADVLRFYLTQSIPEAQQVLDRYNVRYVVLGRLERAYFESVQPCWSGPDSQEVSCDMRGYPYGMDQPDVSALECKPINVDGSDSQLICPTYGLEKFDAMVAGGILKEVYRSGETQIFEVMQ